VAPREEQLVPEASSSQDLELVAKDEDLNLCDIVGAMFRRDNGEERTNHHIEE
jgi:hypothetical protein